MRRLGRERELQRGGDRKRSRRIKRDTVGGGQGECCDQEGK